MFNFFSSFSYKKESSANSYALMHNAGTEMIFGFKSKQLNRGDEN